MQPIDSDSITKLTAALDGMQDFIFLETCRLSLENSRSFLLTDPVCWLECAVGENFDDFFQRAEAYRTEGCFLAGWFGYELGYMLEPVLHRCLWPTSEGSIVARLGVFKKPLIYDHASGGFSGGEGWPVAEDARRSCTVDNFRIAVRLGPYTDSYGKINLLPTGPGCDAVTRISLAFLRNCFLQQI